MAEVILRSLAGPKEYCTNLLDHILCHEHDSLSFVAGQQKVGFNISILCSISPLLSSLVTGRVRDGCCSRHDHIYVTLTDQTDSRTIQLLKDFLSCGVVVNVSKLEIENLKNLFETLGLDISCDTQPITSIIKEQVNNDDIEYDIVVKCEVKEDLVSELYVHGLHSEIHIGIETDFDDKNSNKNIDPMVTSVNEVPESMFSPNGQLIYSKWWKKEIQKLSCCTKESTKRQGGIPQKDVKRARPPTIKKKRRWRVANAKKARETKANKRAQPYLFESNRENYENRGNDNEKVEAGNDSLYCYCQSNEDEGSDMIGCDAPDCRLEWFHFECVGVMIPPEDKWYCPECSKRDGFGY